MDFGDLLHIAKQNSNPDKIAQNKYYSTKYEPPKKESKEKKLSENIKRFLAKKEEEERRNSQIAREKRDNLLASRDTKAKNKIAKMLKTTKSANKSVLNDAVDNNNTAITLQGPDQPDEDDYGYTSQEASHYYNKLMDKYKSAPEEKKFSSSNGRALTKDEMRLKQDRVRNAIAREQEEESLPKKRAPRQSTSHHHSSYEPYEPEPKVDSPRQRRDDAPKKNIKRGPAPPDFQQLLKIAAEKQHQPVEVKVEKSNKEPERLLTKRERREMDERRALVEAKEERERLRQRAIDGPPAAPQKMTPNGRIPKLNSSSQSQEVKSAAKKGESQLRAALSVLETKKAVRPIENVSSAAKRPIDNRIPQRNDNGSSSKSTKPSTSAMKPSPGKIPQVNASQQQRPNGSFKVPPIKPHTGMPNGGRPSQGSKPSGSRDVSQSSKSSSNARRPVEPDVRPRPSAPTSSTKGRPSDGKPRQLPVDSKSRKFPPANGQTRQFPPADVKTRQFPPADVKTRAFPPADVRTRQFPPADVKTRAFPPPDVRRGGGPPPSKKPMMKKRVIHDDDSEYDSEMDDFIDDGPEADDGYSKYIKEIFGYDKSRYRDIDEEDDNMESSFAQQMREESISKRIGIMEDLEDMRMEEQEKKRKKISGKRRRISDD